MLEVRLLGPVTASRSGSEITIDSARRRALLASLALRAGSTVAIDTLCEVLWGDELPANARGNLQSHISRLRTALGEGAVLLDPGGYRLVVDPHGTDVVAVESLAAAAAACRAEAPAAAGALLSDALARWRGPALVEFAEHPAFIADAVRLDELRRTLVDDLHEALLDAGGAANALPEIERAALAQPLRERSQLLLVRALHDSGRSAEALRAADAYRRRLADETGLDPSGALLALERSVLSGEPSNVRAAAVRLVPEPRPVPRPNAGLPRVGRFFGRDAEIAAVRDAIREERVVTIVGPGGVGKTRLVAEVLAEPTAAVAVVALADTRPRDVVSVIAGALGLRISDAELVAAVVEFLSVEQTLLVLDNCEHVRDEVCELVSAVAAACPGVTVLATSRTRLGLPGERVLPLGPLDSGWPDAPAVQLFTDRVRRSVGDVDVTTPEDVQRLCEHLGGVPLAIELAAGRAAVLGAAELAERLDQALDLLEAPGAHEARHATLRRVVEWSYALLDSDDQRVLAALAVFRGGFDLDAAERVASAVSGRPVAVAVSRLADASMVMVDRSGRSPRYGLLESVRQFASDVAADVVARVHEPHATWVATLLDGVVRATAGHDERDAMQRIDLNRHNVRAALPHVLAGPPQRLTTVAGAVAELCLYRPDVEWLRWLRDAAAGAGGTNDMVCAAAARAAYLQGDLDAIEPLARPVVASAAGGRALHVAAHSLAVGALYSGRHDEAQGWWQCTLDDGDAHPTWRLDALAGVALACCYAGDLASARAPAAELEAQAEALASPTYQAFASYVAGEIALAGGDTNHAHGALERAARLAQDVNAEFVRGVALTALASSLARSDRWPRAVEPLRALIELWRRSGTWPQLWTTLRLSAEALAAAGRASDAALVLAAASLDPAAPAVTGTDGARLDDLGSRLAHDLGDDEMAAIELRARHLPRARIAILATQALGELALDA